MAAAAVGASASVGDAAARAGVAAVGARGVEVSRTPVAPSSLRAGLPCGEVGGRSWEEGEGKGYLGNK